MSEMTYGSDRAAIDSALAELSVMSDAAISEGYSVGLDTAANVIRAHLAKVQPAAPDTKRQMYVLSAPHPQPAAPVEVSESLRRAIDRVTKRLEFIERRDGPDADVSVSLRDLVTIRDAALECQRGGRE